MDSPVSAFTATFWKDVAERAVKTFGQTFAAAAVAAGTGMWDTDWQALMGVAGMATLLSVATSLASLPVGGTGTASLVNVVAPIDTPAAADDVL